MPCTTHPAVLENLNPCSRCGKSYCGDCLVEIKSNRFCASCKVEAVKDMQSGVSGTDLPLATVGRRVVAFLVDWLIQVAVIIPVVFGLAFVAAQAQRAGRETSIAFVGLQLLLNVVFMVAVVAYEALFLQLKGATPGKSALGLRVVSADGSPLTPGQAWLRAFIRSLVATCIVVDYIPAFFRKDRCTIHDLAARTRVVKVN